MRTVLSGLRFLLVAAALMLGLSTTLGAQSSQGGLRGTVKDAQSVIPGVAVTLINEATSVSRDTVTNEVGEYSFPAVEPATYTVRVSLAGFRTFEPQGAYYILTECAHFLERLGLADDTAFALWLVKELGVATVPGSSFYAHQELGRTKIRFCFPKTDDILLDAGRRLQALAG